MNSKKKNAKKRLAKMLTMKSRKRRKRKKRRKKRKKKFSFRNMKNFSQTFKRRTSPRMTRRKLPPFGLVSLSSTILLLRRINKTKTY